MKYEDTAFQHLQRIERNYNVFKAILIVISTIIIVAVVIFTSNRLFENSDKNRQLLRCTVITLTSDKTPDVFRSQLQDCLNSTK